MSRERTLSGDSNILEVYEEKSDKKQELNNIQKRIENEFTNDDEVRFSLSAKIPKRMFEDIKLYAKLRRVPVSTFILNITKDYLMTHYPEDPFMKKYKNSQ